MTVPFFESTPTVFPPVIPPCGPLGDIPAFAFAVGDAVLAWTPPDDFASRSANVYLTFSRLPPPGFERHSLGLDLYRRRSGDRGTAREQLVRAFMEPHQRAHAHINSMPSRRPDPVPVSIDIDDVTWLSPHELRWRFAGRCAEPRGAWQFDTLGTAVIIEDSGEKALGFTLDEELQPYNALWPQPSSDMPRAYVEDAFTARIPWFPRDRTYLWTHDVGLCVGAGWRMFGTGYGGPAEGEVYEYRESDGRFIGSANISVLRPEPRAEFALLAEVELELRFHKGYETEVRDGLLPGYGHVIAGGFEVRRFPKDKHRPDDAEDDPEFPNEWEAEPGELVRVAFIAVGRDHVARVRLAVGDNLADRFEAWWQAALERLHVPGLGEPIDPP